MYELCYKRTQLWSCDLFKDSFDVLLFSDLFTVGDDFEGLDMSMVILGKGSDSVVVMFTILNDSVFECPEDFFVDFSISEECSACGVSEGGDSTATVNIEDTDSKYGIFYLVFVSQNVTFDINIIYFQTYIVDYSTQYLKATIHPI